MSNEIESLEQKAASLDRLRANNRERQKRWYDKNVNKAKVLDRRKEQRRVYREYKRGTLSNTTPDQEEPENEFFYDTEEAQRSVPEIVHEPVLEKLTTVPEADIMKIRKVSTSSKMTFDAIVEKLRERVMSSAKASEKTLKNYIALLELLFRATNTPKHTAINLNNPQRLFLQLDNLQTVGKTPRPYAFSSKTNWIQMVVLLADPRNNFKLQVKKEAFEIYDRKLKELQIMGQQRAESKTKDVDIYASVPSFSKILERAKVKYGTESKFYLLLKVYSCMKARDNFDLKIVRSENEARTKNNFIVIPPQRSTRLGSMSPVANMPAKIILKDYKTSKTYGDMVSNLDTETLSLVKSYMETNKLDYGRYLFGEKSQSKFIRDHLRGIGITVKGQNINLLRHSISSEQRGQGLNPAQEAALSRSMGHNPNTSRLYRRELSSAD